MVKNLWITVSYVLGKLGLFFNVDVAGFDLLLCLLRNSNQLPFFLCDHTSSLDFTYSGPDSEQVFHPNAVHFFATNSAPKFDQAALYSGHLAAKSIQSAAPVSVDSGHETHFYSAPESAPKSHCNVQIVQRVQHRHLWNLLESEENSEVLAKNDNEVTVWIMHFNNTNQGRFLLAAEDGEMRTHARLVIDVEDNIESRAKDDSDEGDEMPFSIF
ncbi:hypothetical protein M9H77_35302 [Catharanthus roseus]|uniref:Uncharacterized protein n=1 Tax=Catharanthus roseus TaxID=4058 RepID=A0ACB9ZNM2_CATRO|nr:hypothetical protein M9H77_35302 [Catharanthus roseus]